MEDQSVIDHISIKTMLTPLVPRVESYETRLAATQSDVKTIKRYGGTLFSLLLVSIGIVTAWVKGVFSS